MQTTPVLSVDHAFQSTQYDTRRLTPTEWVDNPGDFEAFLGSLSQFQSRLGTVGAVADGINETISGRRLGIQFRRFTGTAKSVLKDTVLSGNDGNIKVYLTNDGPSGVSVIRSFKITLQHL